MMRRESYLVIVTCVIVLAGSLGWARAQEPKKIKSIEAFDMLNTVPDTYLIDIRTQAEYYFVGHYSKAYNVPYLFFTTQFNKDGEKPSYIFTKNKAFLEQISKAFKKADNLLVLGRDGTRSAQAAKELVGAGFKNIFDVEDGFEGPEFPFFEDPNRHKFYRQLGKRNNIYGFEHRRFYGWQAWGLPWTYETDPKYVYPPDLTPVTK
ncbi:MAG: sulfurtransferase [Deltaproteobacteria bacterium]|nr:sulfurtransferase [Deltaproteobacteria bacterium]